MAARFVIGLAMLAMAQSCPLPQACGIPAYAPPCLPACPPPCAPVCAPACPPGCLQKYRVVLDTCGPNPAPLPVINAPAQVAPTVDKGTIPLPACVPAAQTISNICRCLKTVVKPQVYQQVLAVPSLQRYLQTSHTPVVENIHYEGIPVNCPPSTPDALQAGYIDVAPAVPCAPACLPAPLPAYLPPPLPACLPAPLPAPLPACLPAPLPAYLPAPLPACLPAPLPACLPAPLPAYLPAPLPACLPAPLPACLPAPLPAYPGFLSGCY